MSAQQKQQLKKQLWAIANILRGKISADEYRDYILGFIFYKYLSEKQLQYANQLLETEPIKEYKKITDEETLNYLRDDSLQTLGYFLLPHQLFSVLAAKGSGKLEDSDNYIIDELQEVLKYIENSTMGSESEDDFNHLFEDIDLQSTKLGRTVATRNDIVTQIFAKLSEIDFRLDDVEADVLGDAYEYLIARFAAGAGKSAGEFYTPQQVSKVLAKLVTSNKQRLRSVYDPTCGSGSLLLRVAREIGKENVGEFFGQELNRTTYNLARMNMILHDIHYRNFDIRNQDTLEKPQHLEQRFEAIVANPPFSAHWKSKNNPLNATDDRFSQYGRLAPRTKADYAFVQHMLFQLADNGTMACVLPHGVLFRGAAEGTVREYLIKELNYLDAVIGLPANIFYGTSIPTCILVLSKCREQDDNILFIDASGEDHYIKEGNQNTLRDEDVDLIIETYRTRETKDKYSYVASLTEVAENDYNLNIPRYVDTFEEEEPVDLAAVATEVQQLDRQLVENARTIANFCRELGIEPPF
ncbi:MAG: type I restriction-modification system subunit M [Bacteroidota bacterium]